MYLLDTNIIRTIFNFYYDEELFPELKVSLEELLNEGKIISVKEVYNELERQTNKESELSNWLKANKGIFLTPERDEIDFIKDIYVHRNFQNNVSKKNILNGMPVADPFLVAKAKHLDGVVVTKEVYSKNAAKIPNLCECFNTKYIGMKDFLKILKFGEK